MYRLTSGFIRCSLLPPPPFHTSRPLSTCTGNCGRQRQFVQSANLNRPPPPLPSLYMTDKCLKITVPMDLLIAHLVECDGGARHSALKS